MSMKSEKGTAIVIFALGMTVVLGFCALVIDIGIVMLEKSRISNAVDAAALAGAQELINNKSNAYDVVNSYLKMNGVNPLNAEVVLLDSDTKVSVTVKQDINYNFARILGLDKANLKITSVAECAPISGVNKGIRPFAIEQQPLDFGLTYTLKEGGGAGSNGNYGALALNGNGASNYKANIINGFNGHLKVGDFVYTEPGNMSGPTSQGINALISQCNHSPKCTFDKYDIDCPRIITVIMVDSLAVNGRSSVQIVGFAKFFLEGVAGNGNKSIVTGKFIKTIVTGELSETQTDYGLKGVRLIP